MKTGQSPDNQSMASVFLFLVEKMRTAFSSFLYISIFPTPCFFDVKLEHVNYTAET